MPHSRKWFKWLAALCLLLVASTAVFFLTRGGSSNIEYLSDHEAILRNGNDTFRIGVSFDDAPDFSDESSHFATTIGSEERFYKWTHFFALNDHDATPAGDRFLKLLDRAYVESFDAVSGELLETFEVEQCDAQLWQFTLQSGILFYSKTGELDLVWHILLTTGDELIFRQSMDISQKNVLIFTPDDTPMHTIEELRALIGHIEATATAEDEVILYLPPVIYEGGLTLSRGYTIFAVTDADGIATFTDTVICRAPYPQIIQLVNITFAGNGSGIGLLDLCGTSLDRCTFHNWEIAAKTGKTGWILSFGSTYENNEIALEFNSVESWWNSSEYPDNYFLNNRSAIVINQVSPFTVLTFENSVFRGNEHNVVNFTDQPIDLSNAVIE